VSAARALVSLELDGSPSDVSLSVVGALPADLVIPWTEATIGGSAITAALPAHQLTRLDARVRRTWPLGPYALASAATRVCEALASGSRRRFSCFVMLDGELGARGRVCAMPVVLGPGGVQRILIPSLSVRERVLLDKGFV
jgi:malate/lactate dehydrogenase